MDELISFPEDYDLKDSDDDSNRQELPSTSAADLGKGFNFKEKRVSWVDEREKEGERDENDSDDSEDSTEHENGDGSNGSDYEGDSSDDGRDSDRKPVIRTIKFSHTKVETFQKPLEASSSTLDPTTTTTSTSTTTTTNITSPADIYKLYCPRPILKKSKSSFKGTDSVRPDATGDNLRSYLPDSQLQPSSSTYAEDNGDAHQRDDLVTYKDLAKSRDQAFSGIVKETPVTATTTTTSTTTTSVPSSASTTSQGSEQPRQEQPKRVSKFKAQRMAQKPT